MTWFMTGLSMASHNCSPVATPRVPLTARRKGSLSRSAAIQSQQEFFMPDIAMPFIHCDDLSRRALDLSHSFPEKALIHRYTATELNAMRRPMDQKPKPYKYRFNAIRRWAEVAVSDLWWTVNKHQPTLHLYRCRPLLSPLLNLSILAH